MKSIIDKRIYERPRMTAVPLQPSTAVLQTSGPLYTLGCFEF